MNSINSYLTLSSSSSFYNEFASLTLERSSSAEAVFVVVVVTTRLLEPPKSTGLKTVA